MVVVNRGGIPSLKADQLMTDSLQVVIPRAASGPVRGLVTLHPHRMMNIKVRKL